MGNTNTNVITIPTQLSRPDPMQTMGVGMSTLTARIYQRHVTGWVEWLKHNRLSIGRAALKQYVIKLQSEAKGRSVINQMLAAVKKYARECADLGVISRDEFRDIEDVQGMKGKGDKLGEWLTLDEVRLLMSLPDRTTPIGRRDAALLGLLIGCGLRRDEVVNITWGHLAEVEGRWVLKDFVGKGGKVRSVGVPVWVANNLLVWRQDAAEYNAYKVGADNKGEDLARGQIQLSRSTMRGEIGQETGGEFRKTGSGTIGVVSQVCSDTDDTPVAGWSGRNNAAMETAMETETLFIITGNGVSNANNSLVGHGGRPEISQGSNIAAGLPVSNPLYQSITHPRSDNKDVSGWGHAGSKSQMSKVPGIVNSGQDNQTSDRPILTSLKGNVGGKLSASGIAWIVGQYGNVISRDLSPHDLRRTYARLSLEGGAPLSQIQLSLGHSSIKTTEIYLNTQLKLGKGQSPGDYIEV